MPTWGPPACPDPPHLDAVDHHPYSLSPNRPAANRGDISLADLGKITTIVSAANRYGHVAPAGPKPLWVSEIDWSDAKPLNRAAQARFLDEGFYRLWAQGVSVVLWYSLRDPPGVHNSFKGAGVYTIGGGAKPATAAYRFPVRGHAPLRRTLRRVGPSALERHRHRPAAGGRRLAHHPDPAHRSGGLLLLGAQAGLEHDAAGGDRRGEEPGVEYERGLLS